MILSLLIVSILLLIFTSIFKYPKEKFLTEEELIIVKNPIYIKQSKSKKV